MERCSDVIQIDKGQFAAIVGPSGKYFFDRIYDDRGLTLEPYLGCGKTSIISLLERSALDLFNSHLRKFSLTPRL